MCYNRLCLELRHMCSFTELFYLSWHSDTRRSSDRNRQCFTGGGRQPMGKNLYR